MHICAFGVSIETRSYFISTTFIWITIRRPVSPMVQSNIRSSLPLEILLRVNALYSFIFFLLVTGLFAYKITLTYPLHVLLSEAAISLLFGPIEAFRISWARTGNLTETASFLVFSVLLSVAVAASCAYMALFQTYIAFAEQIASGVELVLVGIESLLEISAIVSFLRK